MTKTLLISRVFPPQVGGSGRWMWELYSRLPPSEFVVVADQSAGSEEFDQTHDLPVVRLPLHLQSWGAFGWRRGSAYLGVYRRLCEIARQHRSKTVHAASCLPEGFLAWMLRRRFGMAYVVYVHGEELNVARTSRELTWMTRRVLRAAELVIANSRNTANLLKAGWPVSEERLRVLHPGVDTQWFQPAPRDEVARRRLGWNDRRVILTVGRLQTRKGHDQLLRALSEIRKAVPDVLYAIVGDGPERDRLEALVDELGLRDHVLLHGELHSDDLLRAYQQCDLFALPNRAVNGDTEGFGIVLLEAQACGKPVIAGNSGGTAEAVNSPESGLVLDCTNVRQLAATIREHLLNGERLERMGAAARKWVVDRFDWTVLCPAAQDILAAVDRRRPAAVAGAVNC